MKEKVLVFGAGALSLGFLGPMLARDYELVFCDLDIKRDVVALLQKEHAYLVNICAETITPLLITGVGGLNLSCGPDNKRARELLKDSRLVFTAVGSGGFAGTLEFIRENKGPGELFVFSCENDKRIQPGPGGPSTDGTIPCETIMGRMCRMDSEGERYRALGPSLRTAAVAEEFSGLPISIAIHRRAGLKGKAWQPMTEEEFKARMQLKLYAHNGSHAYLSYLGALEGLTYFHETGTRRRTEAESLLQDEVIPAVLNAYGRSIDREQVRQYAASLVERITRPTFGDTIARGARGSWDKIAAGERLAEGARFILRHGYTPNFFCRTIAAGIELNRPGGTSPETVDSILREHCGIREYQLISLVNSGMEAL